MAEQERDRVIAYLGLGASLGSRAEHLRTALIRLEADGVLSLRKLSAVYESPHLGLKPGDTEKYPPHLNLVAEIETSLSPEALLRHMQQVETAGGRERSRRWGPRTIDIDLLLYGTLTLHSEILTLPHPGLAVRAFVVTPLAELAPEGRLPDGRMISDLAQAAAIRSQSLWRYAETIEAACSKESRQDAP